MACAISTDLEFSCMSQTSYMIQRLHGEAVRAFRGFVRNILRTGRTPRFGLLRVLYIYM